MTTRSQSKAVKKTAPAGQTVAGYSRAQPPASRAICDALRDLIEQAMPEATAKVWHGSPVWFIGENPVVGYSTSARGVNLLFWNGKAFNEPALRQVGKYQAAQLTFTAAEQIDAPLLGRLLRKAQSDVFDSKSFFQKLRKGK